jgi:DNA-binding PadR family transcriptional regulator
MNSTRMFVLGSLARLGPMHGHQIRRAAKVDRTELWTDIKPGSLYGALHRMAAEGLIVAIRTEQDGSLPARTVYEITEEGRGDLDAHRDEAYRRTRLPTDPFDLALTYSDDLSADEFRDYLTDRRQSFAAQLTEWHHLLDRAGPHLDDLERMGFRHWILRIEAELAWHDELIEQLPALLASRQERLNR